MPAVRRVIRTPTKPTRRDGATCGIVAHALVEARRSALVELRDGPVPPGAPPLPPRFLRHCDEQTVVAVHAVLRVLAGLPRTGDHERHAVVAAACQPGRLITARSLVEFRARGPVTVSPHIVPQCALHSVAGAVSVALGMRGPHLGIGGGPDALAEGLFAALSLVRRGAGDVAAPAAWLVLTEWDAEPALDDTGTPLDDPLCRAVALLLDPAASGPLSLSVHVPAAAAPPAAVTRLAEFARVLEMCAAGAALASWAVACPWGAEVRLESASPATAWAGTRRREAA